VTDDGSIKYPDETLCDLLSCAAAVIMGQRGRGVPAVIIRGITYDFDKKSSVKSILHHAGK
jgi:F420-0:gamma-glutamyl ligase